MYTILVVDDEQIIRKGILEGHPWAEQGVTCLLEAENGLQALEAARKTPPDIAIVDIKMPKMNGLELSKALLALYPHMKIIMLSGYDDFRYAQEAIRIGVVEYLLKPATEEALSEAVSRSQALIKKERLGFFQSENDDRHLSAGRSAAREQFLRGLLAGAKDSPQSAARQAALFELPFTGDWFSVFLIDIDDYSSLPDWEGYKDRELVRFAVGNIVMELLQEDFPQSVLCEDARQNLCVILCADGEKPALLGFARRCRQVIEESLKITVTICVSGRYESLSGVRRAYEDVAQVLDNKLFLGKNTVLHIDDVWVLRESGVIYPKKEEEEILASVFRGDAQGAARSIGSFFQSFRNNRSISREEVKNYCVGLIFMLLQKLREEEAATVEALQNHRTLWLGGLGPLETLEELRGYIEEIFVGVAGVISEMANKDFRGVVTAAKKYIHQNLDSDLSLKTVADYVHLSPNYFTYLFHQEVGETFIEYVSRVKIEKAKALLTDRDVKIYEVGQRIGYCDSKYFSQFFKRHTAMTPTEFRKLSGRAQDAQDAF